MSVWENTSSLKRIYVSIGERACFAALKCKHSSTCTSFHLFELCIPLEGNENSTGNLQHKREKYQYMPVK